MEYQDKVEVVQQLEPPKKEVSLKKFLTSLFTDGDEGEVTEDEFNKTLVGMSKTIVSYPVEPKSIGKSTDYEMNYLDIKTMASAPIEEIYDFYSDKGYTDEQIAGVIGNIGVESLFAIDAESHEDKYGNTAEGLFQWRGERKEALRKFTGQEDIKKIPFMKQLEFMESEMTTGVKRNFAKKFKAEAKDVQTATKMFDDMYEVSGGETIKRRTAYAEEAYDAIKRLKYEKKWSAYLKSNLKNDNVITQDNLKNEQKFLEDLNTSNWSKVNTDRFNKLDNETQFLEEIKGLRGSNHTFQQ